ncbi:hypothetical protein CI105_06275 [Candidatus Izimaplasma bacterium ZiA1]|uniref:hypothetical protein n=1 Tax=Candidatus Izimoplasma sp. ZiA1 TaxID=2024899 RepID=UPI000BAA8AE4|nr:hypothetical protein CI105_06275 [Candidatus Izimaplasma bacterium ZiA1]
MDKEAKFRYRFILVTTIMYFVFYNMALSGFFQALGEYEFTNRLFTIDYTYQLSGSLGTSVPEHYFNTYNLFFVVVITGLLIYGLLKKIMK